MAWRHSIPTRLRRIAFAGLAVGAIIGSGGAAAAMQLPVDLPRTPVTDPLRDALNDRIDRTLDEVDELEDLRRDTLRDLLRRNRDVLERSPERDVIVRFEVTALLDSRESVARLQDAGFRLVRERSLGDLGSDLYVFRAPSGMTTARALRLARQVDPQGLYDFNHIYTRSGRVGEMSVQSRPGGRRVGLIDTGVAADHPDLSAVQIVSSAFHAGAYQPAEHGTAVASLLAGAPGDRLYSADIYGDGPTGGSAESLIAALGWMADNQVGVINISLVGPHNRLLAQITRRLTDRGHLLVAAVGNDGPSADPLFPAAYSEVLAVTSVDDRGRVLPEACRGEHVDFALQGRDVRVASLSQGRMEARGTSFAAPQLAAVLAGVLPYPDAARSAEAMAWLERLAQDAGPPGRDEIYGYGIIIFNNDLRYYYANFSESPE